MLARLSARATLLGIAAACAGVLGLALLLQHRYDMQPCPWCVLQRLIYVAIAAAALLAAAVPGGTGRRGLTMLVLGLCACGVAAALWQHFVAASQASCDLSLAERIVSGLKLDEWLPEVFTAWASCKDAAVQLVGVPFEIWSLSMYLALAGSALWTLSMHAGVAVEAG